MRILKGVALAAVLTSAGVGASQRRDHLQLQGPVTNCYLGPGIDCQQNATHLLYSNEGQQTLMVKGPDGSYTLDAEHGHPLGNQPSPPALAQYLDPAPPVTPSPAQPRTPAPPQASSSKFPLDSVVGPVVALFILAIIGYPVFRHIRHERNRIPIAEIPMATITNDSNVVARPNSLQGIAQEDLRFTISNVLPHRQPVYNAIPTPTSLPSDNGIRGVPLDSRNQQPDPGPLESSAPRQQTSNLGQGLALSLPSQLRGINLGGSILQVDSSIGFVNAPLQQPVSENLDHGAHQVSASSRTHSPSAQSPIISSAPRPPTFGISATLGFDTSASGQQASQRAQQPQQPVSAQLGFAPPHPSPAILTRQNISSVAEQNGRSV